MQLSANNKRLESTYGRRSLDPNLLRKRPSTAESFYTTTSEFICSDAATVYIPSRDSGTPTHATNSEPNSDSYHTPELSQSPVATPSQNREYSGESWSRAFNFSVPYNASTIRTSSMQDLNMSHPILFGQDYSYSHALSDITSMNAPLPERTPPNLHIVPRMAVADGQPSSPGEENHEPKGSIPASPNHIRTPPNPLAVTRPP